MCVVFFSPKFAMPLVRQVIRRQTLTAAKYFSRGSFSKRPCELAALPKGKKLDPSEVPL